MSEACEGVVKDGDGGSGRWRDAVLGMFAFFAFVAILLGVAVFIEGWSREWRNYSVVMDRRAMELSRAMLDGKGDEVAAIRRDVAFLEAIPFSMKLRLISCDEQYPFFNFAYLPDRLRRDPQLLAYVVRMYGEGLRDGSYVVCSGPGRPGMGRLYSWGGGEDAEKSNERYVAQRMSLPSGYVVYKKNFPLGSESSLDIFFGLTGR